MDLREAAGKVATKLRSTTERALYSLIESTLDSVMKMLVYYAGDDDRIVEILAENGVYDPTDDDILDAIEQIADDIDIDDVFSKAPKVIQTVVLGAIIAGKRMAKKDWINKLSYENALKVAKERGLERIEYLLERYPKLSAKIIEWLRANALGRG